MEASKGGIWEMESEIFGKKRQRILHPELYKGTVDTLNILQVVYLPLPTPKNHCLPEKRYCLITDLLQRNSYNGVYSLGKTY